MISRTLIDRIRTARRVSFFTGAGISADSGVATFRSKDGLWTKFKPEELANVNAFLANPQMVWEWYQARREVILHAQPNAAHSAIAALESIVPAVSVITQNIDGLHIAAGSREVIELHGNIRKNYCQECGTRYDDAETLTHAEVMRCTCGGLIRPDVVWFGELLPVEAVELAERRAKESDILFSVGTSSIVWPAAGIPLIAKESGAYVVEINPEPTPLSRHAHESLRGTSSDILSALMTELSSKSTEANDIPQG